MEEHNHLLQPLIPTTTTTPTTISGGSSSTSQFVLRISFLFFVGVISIWANVQASKGFNITIVNDISHPSLRRRFDVFYVQNDKATRIVLNTSSYAERILYPHQNLPKKLINHVTIKLTSYNLTQPVMVITENNYEYVIHISSKVMEEEKSNINNAMVRAVQLGMARVWLWDGKNHAPVSLVNGMVEYVSNAVGFTSVPNSMVMSGRNKICWKDRNPKAVANFLSYCHKTKNGFIGRLNQAMQDLWDERMVDDALGLAGQELCKSYISWTGQQPLAI